MVSIVSDDFDKGNPKLSYRAYNVPRKNHASKDVVQKNSVTRSFSGAAGTASLGI